MCYSAKSVLSAQLKNAIRWGNDPALVEELIQKLKKLEPHHSFHYVNAFQHPKLLAQTGEENKSAELLEWGLIPHWCKNMEQAKQLSEMTFNARSESIFEKPAFRDSAKNKRCIIALDGYYEYMQLNKKKYPFYIQLNSGPMALAGLWSEWTDRTTGEVKKTISIVTTEANDLLKLVHNTKQRMPVILDEERQFEWMDLSKNPEKIFEPFPSSAFQVHSTPPILGHAGVGDSDKASSFFEYPELAFTYMELNRY